MPVVCLAIRQGLRQQLKVVSDSFHPQQIRRILIYTRKLRLPELFRQPPEQLVPQQYSVRPVFFLVLTHEGIVSHIGFSDPLFSNSFVFIFRASDFEFVSDFEIRISDFARNENQSRQRRPHEVA